MREEDTRFVMVSHAMPAVGEALNPVELFKAAGWLK